MKIGDLYYKGEKISDIARQSLEYCKLDRGCDNCKGYKLCNPDVDSLGKIEIELPPTIKAVDITADNVNHPSHYETGKYECIDVMTETIGVDAVKGFCICNAFKYMYRHKRKNSIEDIKKAKWYIDKYLEMERAENDR